MTHSQPARTAPPRIRIHRVRLAGLLVVVIAAVAAALGSHPRASSSPPRASAPAATPTILDGADPGVAKLRPALRDALERAAEDAAGDGVELVVNSGWRSAADEDRLRREAVAKYGSEAEAARWVATGTTSAHVSGDAVDVGPHGATPWLAAHGAAYGLCQIYRNEPWHYELRRGAIADGCPAMYADPTQDPRMQR